MTGISLYQLSLGNQIAFRSRLPGHCTRTSLTPPPPGTLGTHFRNNCCWCLSGGRGCGSLLMVILFSHLMSKSKQFCDSFSDYLPHKEPLHFFSFLEFGHKCLFISSFLQFWEIRKGKRNIYLCFKRTKRMSKWEFKQGVSRLSKTHPPPPKASFLSMRICWRVGRDPWGVAGFGWRTAWRSA